MTKSSRDSPLVTLMQAIRARNSASALRVLKASPDLAKASIVEGATRRAPKPYYEGDTALHAAAAAYQTDVVRELIALGADVRARNRRRVEPLHYAAVGVPGSPAWSPSAQAATIALLIEAGADPNAPNMDGAAPLHRAVRTRCAAAVEALIEGGADPHGRNKNGSTPMNLASHNTGRGGSGSPEAKAQQREIVDLLTRYGAKSNAMRSS